MWHVVVNNLQEGAAYVSTSTNSPLIMKQLSLIAALSLVALSSQALHIDNDLDRAQQLARAEGKLVLVKFYATWCGPCKTMTKTLQDNRVKRITDAAYITVSVDVENFDGIGYAQKYNIEALPTMLYFNSQGDLLGRTNKVVGAATLSKLLAGYDIARNRKAYRAHPYAHRPPAPQHKIVAAPNFQAPQKPQVKSKGWQASSTNTTPTQPRKRRPMRGLRRRVF